MDITPPTMQEAPSDQAQGDAVPGPSGKSRKEMDEELKKFRSTPWLRGRLALSEQAARYELPMDLLSLESMAPEKYLRTFTRISAKRQQIYNKVFMNNKNKTSTISFNELDKAVGEVLITTFDRNKHLPLILETTKITETTKIDLQLFSAICALAERILYPNFVTEDTENLPEFKRDHLEIADFQHLAWKLTGVNVNPDMLRLLERINQQPLRIIAGPTHHGHHWHKLSMVGGNNNEQLVALSSMEPATTAVELAPGETPMADQKQTEEN